MPAQVVTPEELEPITRRLEEAVKQITLLQKQIKALQGEPTIKRVGMAQACKILFNTSARQMGRYIEAGIIKSGRKVNGQWTFEIEELQRLAHNPELLMLSAA